jgi:hypothetical protein
MGTHFSPEFPLHNLHPQPSAEPGVCHHWGKVNVAHGKFPAALLSVMHTLTAEDIEAGLSWCEIPITVHI